MDIRSKGPNFDLIQFFLVFAWILLLTFIGSAALKGTGYQKIGGGSSLIFWGTVATLTLAVMCFQAWRRIKWLTFHLAILDSYGVRTFFYEEARMRQIDNARRILKAREELKELEEADLNELKAKWEKSTSKHLTPDEFIRMRSRQIELYRGGVSMTEKDYEELYLRLKMVEDLLGYGPTPLKEIESSSLLKTK